MYLHALKYGYTLNVFGLDGRFINGVLGTFNKFELACFHAFSSIVLPKDGVIKPKSKNIRLHISYDKVNLSLFGVYGGR